MRLGAAKTARESARAFVPVRFTFWIQAAMSSVLFRSMTRIEGCDAVIRVYDEDFDKFLCRFRPRARDALRKLHECDRVMFRKGDAR
jgi:hypothetical protein